MRLTWFHQNTRFLDGIHTYVNSKKDTNNIEMQEFWHTLTIQEERGLQYHKISIVSQQDYYLQSIIK